MATCSYASSTIVPVRASESSRVVISMGSSNFGLCKNFKSLTTLKNFRTFTQRNIVKVRMSFQDGFNSANSDSYLEAEVVDAVAMSPERDHLFMTMVNGSKYEVTHINPMAGKLLFKEATPTMILKMAENENVMLPIVVGATAMGHLLQAMRKEQSARPNCYDLMMQMIHAVDYEIYMVRIEQRVVDTYYARLYICKRGTSEYGADLHIDARPSDAINLAVRCNVPIFVHRSIVLNDAVQLSTGLKNSAASVVFSAAKQYKVDSAREDMMGEELTLVTKMMTAVEDERYSDAARIRDQLTQLRQGNWKKV